MFLIQGFTPSRENRQTLETVCLFVLLIVLGAKLLGFFGAGFFLFFYICLYNF